MVYQHNFWDFIVYIKIFVLLGLHVIPAWQPIYIILSAFRHNGRSGIASLILLWTTVLSEHQHILMAHRVDNNHCPSPEKHCCGAHTSAPVVSVLYFCRPTPSAGGGGSPRRPRSTNSWWTSSGSERCTSPQTPALCVTVFAHHILIRNEVICNYNEVAKLMT